MGNIITGAIAILLATVFLLYYVVSLSSIALAIIVISVIVMMCFDYYKEIKAGSNQNDN